MRTLIMYLAPLLVGGLCACGAGASGSPDALTDDAAPDDAAPDDAAPAVGAVSARRARRPADPAICHGAACPAGVDHGRESPSTCAAGDPAGR
jgi:hypothetical protein